MSGLVKAVFKPIKKIWKGVKKVASKVWDKIKKPVMIAAGLYLTAGLGASLMTGSLASGFGSVNSAIGGFFGVGGETAIAGETINGSVASSMAEATANTTLTAGELAGGVSSGVGSTAGSATVSGATGSATAAGMEASLANGFTAESLASAATGGGSTATGSAADGSLLGNAATEGTKQAAQNISTMGADSLNTAYQTVDTASKVSPNPGFFESVKNTASNVMDGNWAEAGGNAWDAVSSGAGNVWDAATGTTGAALLTSNLLQGYSQYEAAKDAEERWKRRSYWGMDGYGNTASTPERRAPTPRGAIAPTTIDDLIRESRRG